jgi:hypothetical protein
LDTLKSWAKSDKQPMSGRGALLLAGQIRTRAKAGLALAFELEHYAASRANRRKAGPGFRAIDPETGLSGRPRVGRKRKVKEV